MNEGEFLKELVAIEKQAIYSQGMTQAARLNKVERLVDEYFREKSDAPKAD